MVSPHVYSTQGAFAYQPLWIIRLWIDLNVRSTTDLQGFLDVVDPPNAPALRVGGYSYDCTTRAAFQLSKSLEGTLIARWDEHTSHVALPQCAV